MSGPVVGEPTLIPLDDRPRAQVRDWIVIKPSKFEEPDPGTAYTATLSEPFALGSGDTHAEALEKLACDLEYLAASVRKRKSR